MHKSDESPHEKMGGRKHITFGKKNSAQASTFAARGRSKTARPELTPEQHCPSESGQQALHSTWLQGPSRLCRAWPRHGRCKRRPRWSCRSRVVPGTWAHFVRVLAKKAAGERCYQNLVYNMKLLRLGCQSSHINFWTLHLCLD